MHPLWLRIFKNVSQILTAFGIKPKLFVSTCRPYKLCLLLPSPFHPLTHPLLGSVPSVAWPIPTTYAQLLASILSSYRYCDL